MLVYRLMRTTTRLKLRDSPGVGVEAGQTMQALGSEDGETQDPFSGLLTGRQHIVPWKCPAERLRAVEQIDKI